MSNNIPMGTGANGPIIDRHYADSHAHQWVREVLVNSWQAEATEIKFGTEWQAVSALNVHRRIVIDNGHGIARADLPNYLNTFGGSGKTVGATTANYGVGLKTSALPWNRYGLVIISRKDDETSMLWLDHNPKTDEYGARMFDVGDKSGVMQATIPLDEMVSDDGDNEFIEDGVDWTKVFPEHYESGTAIIFLGNSPDSHTIEGDPNRSEWGKYDIARFINSTFMELPGVKVWVEQYESQSDDPKDWPKSSKGLIQGRYPKGVVDAVRTGLTPAGTKDEPEYGVIDVPATETHAGAEIHWWFASGDVPMKDSQGHKPKVPFTATTYCSHADIWETFSKGDPQMAAAKFAKPKSVHKRLSIVILPKDGGGHTIFPNATRTELRVQSQANPNAPLPYEAWLAYWHQNMPEVVRSAIEDHYASSDSSAAISDDDRRRLADKFLRYFRSTVSKPVPDKSGTTTAPDGGTTPVRKRRRRVKVQKDGSNNPDSNAKSSGSEESKASERKTRAGMVEVTVMALGDHPWAIDYDSQEHRAVVNSSHPVYETTMQAILDEQTAKRGSLTGGEEKKIRESVDRAMRTVACVAISHAVGIAVQQESAESRDRMLSDAALSTCMYGIAPVRDMASGFIGHVLGESKKKAAA